MRSVLIFLFALLLSACYYDSEEYLFPELRCDTVNTGYTEVIQPLMETHCYTCHSNRNAPQFGSGLALEDFSDVKREADNGSLFGAINHEEGYSPMPKNGDKLDDCTLQKFRIWIDNGAPDN